MRISEKFKELEKKREKALIIYISCGDPSAEETVRMAGEMVRAGCDILELGLPFSDPIADGPVIQAASQRAIAAGMNTDKYFETCRKIGGVPKVCMTYYNLMYSYGLARFAKGCADAGITGLIVPDLPPEEAGPLKKACDSAGVDLIYIVSPQTSKERLALIKRSMGKSKGFVYLQSVLGVTGARESMRLDLEKKISDMRKTFSIPIAVGFGVSKPEQVSGLAKQGADGVIVGSAVVKMIAEGGDAARFAKELKAATR